jgi:hypothetical protein
MAEDGVRAYGSHEGDEVNTQDLSSRIGREEI